ncbi:MAG: TIGR00341 family protein [Hyphomonadaceae bacterium]|nr:TIGR00341 family protein [Hyphomonadaceae bacterium]
MRFIKVSFPENKTDAVIKAIEAADPIDWAVDQGYGKFEKAVEIVVAPGRGQKLVDSLQSTLGPGKDWRIVVLPVEATLPRVEDEPSKENNKTEKLIALREELYQGVVRNCQPNTDFFILTVLSAIVAAIGLHTSNVAVIIAAMVIAPLLGPILAFSLGSALGDIKLMLRASKTALAGFAVGFATAIVISQLMTIDMTSPELLDRSTLGLGIIVLALASGAAAALSLTSGLSSALVGVMVAVALLPPSVASALFAGAGEWKLAASSALLLALNVVCTLLSALIVFVWKGVRPRTWLAKRTAKRSVLINGIVWAALLGTLILLSTYLS